MSQDRYGAGGGFSDFGERRNPTDSIHSQPMLETYTDVEGTSLVALITGVRRRFLSSVGGSVRRLHRRKLGARGSA
jgi:hypothetical protein